MIGKGEVRSERVSFHIFRDGWFVILFIFLPTKKTVSVRWLKDRWTHVIARSVHREVRECNSIL